MRELFFTAFVLACVVQIIILCKLIIRKNNVLLKRTIIPFAVFFAYVICIYVFDFVIPYYVLLLSLVCVFLNSFIGHYLDYYNKSKVFDRFLHCLGSFSYALLLYCTLINLTLSGGSKLFRTVSVAAIGIAAGAVFEILEFLSDKKQHSKNQKGLKDTNFDIIFNIIGSVAAGVFAYAALLD